MIDDDDDREATPAATPNAKKSSGTWKFNLDAALCGREGCGCRRDAHATRGGGSHRWECMNCDKCSEFVLGGPDYETIPDTLPAPKSSP